MYRKLCLVAFCLLVSVSCIYCTIPEGPFYRVADTYYESKIEGTEKVDITPGYVDTVSEIIVRYKQGKANSSELNKFGVGLDTLFTNKFLQKIYNDELSSSTPDESSDSNLDTITLPDYKDETGLTFKELVVYNFPAFKKGPKPQPIHNGLSSANLYQVSVKYYSDNFLVTGSFIVTDSKYFFVYIAKSSTFSVYAEIIRTLQTANDVDRSLKFDFESLIHTYDSSYENSTIINSQVNATILNNVIPYILSKLSQRISNNLKYQSIKNDLEFLKKNELLVLSAISESALYFIENTIKDNNGSDVFAASDIVFESGSATAPMSFKQKYHSINLKGFTNYVEKPERVYYNTSISDNGRLYNMSQGIEFKYSKDGDKHAVFSYVFNNGRRDFPKEWKVKSIIIIKEYIGDLVNKYPVKVQPNRKVFFNEKACLVKFELYEFDESSSFVVNHLGNDICRTIEKYIF